MASLTERQIAGLQRRLEQRRTELRAEIREELLAGDDMRYADLAGRVHDSGDESVADLLADMDVARIDRQITEIRGIETALSRIAMGLYGVCSDCDGDIDYMRLQTQPAAERCVACQEQHERSYAHEGTPSL